MFTLPDLPFPPAALEPFIDRETMLVHHDKHHAAYVKNLNDLLPDKSDADLSDILTHLDTIPETIRTKVKNNAGGVLNHNLYWKWMSPQKTAPTTLILPLKDQFLTAALSHFGSGWAWLVSEKGQLSVVTTPNQDSPNTTHLQQILGVDVCEHAD